MYLLNPKHNVNDIFSFSSVILNSPKLHMRVHQEEKKYLCPDCGYKCKWATQLKYHMTKHTGMELDEHLDHDVCLTVVRPAGH